MVSNKVVTLVNVPHTLIDTEINKTIAQAEARGGRLVEMIPWARENANIISLVFAYPITPEA